MNPTDLYGANFATTAGLLTTADVDETVYDTTAVINYAIKGKAYTKAAVTDGASPTTDGNTGELFESLSCVASGSEYLGEGCVMVWALNAAGAVSVYQSNVKALDCDGNFVVAAEFPSIPDSVCPFAYQVIKAEASVITNWMFGTDGWNDLNAPTVVDILVLPDTPQSA